MPSYEELPPGIDPTTRKNPVPRPNYLMLSILSGVMVLIALIILWFSGGSSLIFPADPTATYGVAPAPTGTVILPASPTGTVILAMDTPKNKQPTVTPPSTQTPGSTQTPVIQIVYKDRNHDVIVTRVISVQVTRIVTHTIPYPVEITVIVPQTVVHTVIVTATPTDTPTPTETQTPTVTPTLADTPTPTSTPTETVTPTVTELSNQ